MIKITNYDGDRASARFLLCIAVLLLTTASLSAQNFELLPKSGQLTNAEELFNAGNDALFKGDYQLAVQKYSDAIAAAPSMALPYINRGVAYVSLSKFQEAMADAEKALSLLENGSNPSSHSAIAYQVKGIVFQNQKNYKLAIESFSKSLDFEPSDAKLWNSRGGAYFLSKDYGNALKDFDKAIELDASKAMFYSNRASVKMGLNDVAAALKDLDEALKLNDADPLVYYTRGNAYSRLSKFDEALKDYDRAISLKPKSPYYYGRGRIYLVLGKYDLAIKDNTDAIALDPTNINALYNRAMSYHKMGKTPMAIEDMRKAVAVNEKSATMRYTLGFLLFRSGQFASAATEASKAIELAPNWRSPYSLRASAYAKVGNAIKAKADRTTAANLSSSNKPVEDASFFELTIFAPEDLGQY